MGTTIRWRRANDGWVTEALDIRVDNQEPFSMAIPLSDEAMTRVLVKGLFTGQEQHTLRERFATAYKRLAVRRVESLAAEGLLDDLPAAQRERFTTSDVDDELLASMARDKACDYQRLEARDLYCSAAAQHDATVVGTQGLRSIAPTSRAACLQCKLPDTDFLCSHLHHPRVVGGQLDQGELVRSLGGAICDLGRPEITDPQLCKLGGHPCWERVVERHQPAASPSAPLALHDALDFFDAVWELTFARPLLRIKASAGPGRLALSPTTRDEVATAASDLADIFARFDVPDDLLDDEATKIPKAETLRRLEAALQGRSGIDRERVGAAVRVLQAANQVRSGTQHSGASTKAIAALGRLGVETPVADWPAAWNRVRSVVVQALGELREETRKVPPAARAEQTV
jgi:hypothetical protein